MRLRLVCLLAVTACSSKSDSPKSDPKGPAVSPLRSALPPKIEGNQPTVIEDGAGIIAIYKRADGPASVTNPWLTLAIMSPTAHEREAGLAVGWQQPHPDDGTTEIVDRDFHGHRAQLVRSKSDCGETRLGKPIDPTKCTTTFTLGVRLANDRLLLVQREPANRESDVLAFAEALDLKAIEAAAQQTVVPAEPK